MRFLVACCFISVCEIYVKKYLLWTEIIKQTHNVAEERNQVQIRSLFSVSSYGLKNLNIFEFAAARYEVT